jgi:hypothetical protein
MKMNRGSKGKRVPVARAIPHQPYKGLDRLSGSYREDMHIEIQIESLVFVELTQSVQPVWLMAKSTG